MYFKKFKDINLPKKFVYLYKQYGRNAKTRGYEFGLSRNNFLHLVNSNCTFCGSEPVENSRGLVCNGIDRHDNSKGYFTKNVLTCCSVCNKMKGTLTVKQFFDKIKKIHDNASKKEKLSHDIDDGFFLSTYFRSGKYLPFYNVIYLVKNGFLKKEEVKYDIPHTVYDFKKESIEELSVMKSNLKGFMLKKKRKEMDLDWLYKSVKEQWEDL